MVEQFDLLRQYKGISVQIDKSIQAVLESGSYILGENVKAFEDNFSKYLGSTNGLGVANGTDALILALKSLEIGVGDEVITTCFTAIPTASAIIAAGAKPVFIDIDPDTFLIDLAEVDRRISTKTKAIVVVHLFGNVVDVPFLKRRYPTIPVIEDACQAHGSSLNTIKAGTLGDIGCFSFYPTKNLGAYGDGGFVNTPIESLYKKLKLLRMYGMINREEIVVNGINSRLDEIQAAVLNIKLQYLNEYNKRRREIANVYISAFRSYPLISQKFDVGVESNFHIFAMKIEKDRDELVGFLKKSGINTNIYYRKPVSLQPANHYLRSKDDNFANALKVCSEIFSLPLYPELSDEEIDMIVRSIKNYFGG